MPQVEDGKYTVQVEMNGYVPLKITDFALNRRTSPLKATLVRLVNLNLWILNQSGEPVQKTQVSVLMRGEDDSTSHLERLVSTNKSGELSLPNMIPGRYSMQLIAPGVGYGVLDLTEVNQQTAEEPIEIRLQSGGTLQVTARQGTDGQGLGNSMLTLYQVVGDSAREAAFFLVFQDRYALLTDEGGRLNLTDVPPGRYEVRLLMAGLKAPAIQTVEIKAGSETSLEFSFPLPETSTTLAIELRDEKDMPLANTQWCLIATYKARTDGAAPDQPDEYGRPTISVQGYMRGRTNGVGQSALFPLQPGRWQITMSLKHLTPAGNFQFPAGITQQIDVPEGGGTAVFNMESSAR